MDLPVSRKLMGVWESIVLVQCHEMAVLPYNAIFCNIHHWIYVYFGMQTVVFQDFAIVNMFLQYELLAVMIHDPIL